MASFFGFLAEVKSTTDDSFVAIENPLHLTEDGRSFFAAVYQHDLPFGEHRLARLRQCVTALLCKKTIPGQPKLLGESG